MVLSPRYEVIEIDPEFVPYWVSTVKTAQYAQIAASTILFYDTVTTLDKEALYFWKTPISSVAFIYFMNRYIGIFGAVAALVWNVYYANYPLCHFAAWTISLSTWCTIVLMDYILMIRVLALYHEERRLSIFLKAGIALEAAAKAVAFVYATMYENIMVGQLSDNTTICGSEFNPAFWTAALGWIVPLAYNSVLLVLALYKATKFWRESGSVRSFGLVKVLIQDQVLYFFFAVCCCVFNILTYVIEDLSLGTVFSFLGSPSFLCIFGSRMLFNLKEAGERRADVGSTYRMTTLTNIQFT